MNILASYNWIKEYLRTSAGADDFAREMSLKSMSVESVRHIKESFENMVVGEVVELKPHPDADRLRIASTDIGNNQVEIVCGGNNLREGMKVFVALPGASVRWHGEGEPVVLEEAKIRGVKSFGMICAPEEVGFDKAPYPQGGIWDLTDLTDAKPGTTVVEAFGLDDTIFDIEITTNRPDAMSIIGLAREGAAATGSEFEFEAPSLMVHKGNVEKDLKVSVNEKELCPRYMAVAIDGIKVGPSPLWLQMKLLMAGHRPINNIVDITNFVLHEYGQPLHAFDYEKLGGGEIVVRRATNGEKFLALDGNEYELSNDNLVIADASKPVAIAGVMGGEDSGTAENTKTIVFEAATFDPVSVRRTARALNLFSDSQLLFEKGLSTQSPEYALARAVELTLEIAGGRVASEIIDKRAASYSPLMFELHPKRVADYMGVEIPEGQMLEILAKLGFEAEQADGYYDVKVPYWRDHDIENEVDLIEEIARIYGYHKLPPLLPQSPPPGYGEDKALAWERKIKNYLVAAGYTEFFSYSFVSEGDLARYGIDPRSAIAVHNPLSSDLTHMRTTLMPSALSSIEANQGEVRRADVFELSRVYIPQRDDLPDERTNLVIAKFGVENIESAFLDVKGAVEALAKLTGLTVEFDRLGDAGNWHPNRSAKIIVEGVQIGTIGQVDVRTQEAFKIDRAVVAAEIDIEAVIGDMRSVQSYEPIPEYPSIERDIAIIVDEKAEYAAIERTIREQSSIIESVRLFDVYRGTGIPEGKKSVALSIVLRAPDRTLSSEHADDVMKSVKSVLENKFGAVLR